MMSPRSEAPVRRSADGTPLVSRREWRLSRLVVAAAALWLTWWACAGLFGPLLAGHYASSASVGIIADNMLRWEIAGPVWAYTAAPPDASAYYCHHPWGIFWTQAGFTALLGRHDFVCRLPAVMASVGTVVLLYRLGTALWRPAAGALAAVAFVCLPITLSFAHFNALEVPVMFWSTLGLWGYWRYLQAGRRRHLFASSCGWFFALNADWPAFMLLGTLLALEWLRARLPAYRFRPPRRVWLGRWWLLSASLAVLVGLGYLALFQHHGKLDTLLHSYDVRANHALPWFQALVARRYWLELMFTPLALWLGAAAAAWCLFEWLWRRRWTAMVPLAVGVMATVQYLLFRQGADVHIFWPHYYALFFALGCGALANAALGWTAARLPRLRWPLLTAVCLLLLLIARDGVEAASYARASGGRFNEKGLYIDSDGDKTAALQHIAQTLRPGQRVALHRSMRGTWSQVWSLGGRVVRPHALRSKPGDARFVADSRFMPDAVQKAWIDRQAITAVGPYWWLRPGRSVAAPQASGIAAAERSWLGGYLMGGHEPAYSIAEDPFLSWALRSHFGLPAAEPAAAPQGLEQQRIAHNIALQRGDAAAAAAFRDALVAQLDGLQTSFEDGTKLLGTRFEAGSRPRLWLLFEAAGPLPPGRRPALRSRVVEAPRWSTTMADPTVREVGPPLSLKASRWRRGWLYSYPVTLRQRPGREVFELYFRDDAGPRPAAATMHTAAAESYIEVLRLPR